MFGGNQLKTRMLVTDWLYLTGLAWIATETNKIKCSFKDRPVGKISAISLFFCLIEIAIISSQYKKIVN